MFLYICNIIKSKTIDYDFFTRLFPIGLDWIKVGVV